VQARKLLFSARRKFLLTLKENRNINKKSMPGTSKATHDICNGSRQRYNLTVRAREASPQASAHLRPRGQTCQCQKEGRPGRTQHPRTVEDNAGRDETQRSHLPDLSGNLLNEASEADARSLTGAPHLALTLGHHMILSSSMSTPSSWEDSAYRFPESTRTWACFKSFQPLQCPRSEFQIGKFKV